jgi:Ca2+-binding EF-hand superfamily protein
MMDRNGDGRVERSEFEENGTDRFTRLDTDSDGRVSNDEFRTQRHGWGLGRHHDKLPVE